MKVLILGGTGAMGMYLTDLLSSESYDVFVTSRSEKDNKPHVSYIRGDAHNKVFLSSLLKNHYDAIVDFMIYTNEEFKDRVKSLLSATQQYFFISSSRVYDPRTKNITESSPLLIDTLKTDDYLTSHYYSLYKAQQERILAEAGTAWTVIRPYITYSSERLPLGVLEKEDWLYRALKGRTIVFSETIRNKQTVLTWGKDVAKGIASLIGQKDALEEAFHIVGDNTICWNRVLSVYTQTIQRITGFCPKVLYASDDYLMRGGLVDQINNDRVFDHSFDNSKICRYLTKAAFITPEEGLENCLIEFLKKPRFKAIPWTMEGRRDKISRGLTPLREIPSVRNKVYYLACRYLNK